MNSTIALRKDGSKRVLISEFYEGHTNYIEVSVNNSDYDENYLPTIKDFSYRLLTNPNDNLVRWVSRDSGFSPASSYVSIESIEQAEYLLWNYINVTIPAKVESGKNHPVYAEMVENMEFYGLPSCYESDFYFHDTMSLSEYPPRFIWILRDGGTHFITCKNEWNFGCLEYKHSKPHYFIYDSVLNPNMAFYECDKNSAIQFYNLCLE